MTKVNAEIPLDRLSQVFGSAMGIDFIRDAVLRKHKARHIGAGQATRGGDIAVFLEFAAQHALDDERSQHDGEHDESDTHNRLV